MPACRTHHQFLNKTTFRTALHQRKTGNPPPRGLPANQTPPNQKSELRHRLVQRGVKLVHRRLGLVAHVGESERGAFDFSVAAVNQETLILDELLQLDRKSTRLNSSH